MMNNAYNGTETPIQFLVGVVASVGVLLALSMQGRGRQRHEGIHGTAHWADAKE